MRTRLLPFHLFQMPQQTMFPLLSGLFPKDMPAALKTALRLQLLSETAILRP